ncbi:hypothetical protein FRC03_002497 [Tulasnella sp. 419]|nr:hypothetical protein FRC02_009709 [Tulasnella sp. 418]KAG8943404.1 hypothetical protein FRC03_002497 [Tulasnella sp. 419]
MGGRYSPGYFPNSGLYHQTPDEDDENPEEFVYYDEGEETPNDTSSSDYSMTTGSGGSQHHFQPPPSEYSGSDMSISVASGDIVYPHDSISQRGSDEKSVASETPSVVSFNSQVDGHLFRELHGRAFNTQSDTYMLPADDVEHSRLDVQHNLLRLNLNNSLYPAPELVRKVLAPGPEAPSVLDIGTGSGRWVLDMAAEFPHAEIVGLDLAPPTLTGIADIPSNCRQVREAHHSKTLPSDPLVFRFEVDNANLPLDHYTNCFNLVHVRGCEVGIIDYEYLLYNLAQTLKSGGMLILCGGSPQLYDENHEPMPVTLEGYPGFTRIQRVIGEAYNAYLNRGNRALDCMLHWGHWLENNPNYEDSVVYDTYIPLGPWPTGMNQMQSYVGELMRYDISHVLHSYKPLLLLDGIPSDQCDQMIQDAITEMKELKVHAYVRWRYAWAIRKNTPWAEKLEKPEPVEVLPALNFAKEFKEYKAMSTGGSAAHLSSSGNSA